MQGFILIIAACFMWAIDTLIRYPLLGKGVPASKIVFYEHLLLTLLFLTHFYRSRFKIWHAQISHMFSFFVIGALGSAWATLCFTKAFTLLNPSLVILLQKLQPLVAVSLAYVLLKEPIKKQFVLWGSVSLLGAVLISSDDIFRGQFSWNYLKELFSGKAFEGYGYTLMAVVGWGASTVFGKMLINNGYTTKDIMSGRFIIGFICLLPLLIYWQGGELDFAVGGDAFIKICIMVVISGPIAMYLYYRGLGKTEARYCAVAEMFFPLCAVIINWVFLKTPLNVVQMIGGALLITGSVVIQTKHL